MPPRIYSCRDAPSPVGLCLLCLDLSVSCVRDACRLRARVFHAQRRSRHFVFDTHIKSQPARTLYDIKCVAALLIRPRKVTEVHIMCVLCVCVQVQDELNRLPLGSVPVFLTVACFLVQEGGDLRVRNNLGQAPANSCPADKRDIVLNYLNKSKSVVVLSLSACCLCVCVY